jgi:hypothetical protein
VALDAPDIDRLATFYERLAGWQRVPDDDDDDEWITLDTGDGWRMGLQRATGHVPPHWRAVPRPADPALKDGACARQGFGHRNTDCG